MQLLDIDLCTRVHQITKKERFLIAHLLKCFPLTILGPLSIDEAMVTNGGISTKEINAKTMESRLVPGLYFAGEIIDGCGKSGGYNLQQAFSTGYLAGEKACA
jgi:predicted flavoprotein YhiN